MDILEMRELAEMELTSNDCKEQTEKNDAVGEAEYSGALKKIVGVFLIVVAAVFGGLLTRIPAFAAFAVIFAYIFLQMRIWLN